MNRNSLRIANIARAAPEWLWISERQNFREHQWHFESTIPRNSIERKLPIGNLARLRASLGVRRFNPDIVFSHGPWETLYTAFMLYGKPSVRHIAMSFNFTDLPTGKLLAAMRKFFPAIEKFVVYSTMERALYSELFGIPIDRFDFVYWGVDAPIKSPDPLNYAQPYFVALGGEARDYRSLIETARLRPNYKFVIIARSNSVDETHLPKNVVLKINAPYQEAWSSVWHAEASLIPLRTGQTPNGHVTLVGSMLLGKPIIITDSAGVRDYVKHKESAILVPAKSPAKFAEALDEINADSALGPKIAADAKRFALQNCTEQAVAKYVERFLSF